MYPSHRSRLKLGFCAAQKSARVLIAVGVNGLFEKMRLVSMIESASAIKFFLVMAARSLALCAALRSHGRCGSAFRVEVVRDLLRECAAFLSVAMNGRGLIFRSDFEDLFQAAREEQSSNAVLLLVL